MFLQINDIKHIEQVFYSDAWVMPQGFGLGELGCPAGGGGILCFEHAHVA